MILTEYIHDIFIARCKDTGERPRKEEASQFKKQVQTRCTGRILANINRKEILLNFVNVE